LPENSKIKTLSFKNTEHLGRSDADRKSLFDIYCEAENGEKFIVELQKAKQNFFKERTVYYSTFPIREQAEKGEWDYNLSAVFCIGILDFTFDDYGTAPEKNEVVHTIKLKDQNGHVFYHKLTYIYLEMPNFKKAEPELGTRLDKWLFFIKNLEDFQTIPSIFKDGDIFEGAFEKAELAKFNPAEWESYESSLKEYRDIKGYIDTAFDEGKAEGKLQVAKAAKLMGLSVQDIVKLTGLTESDINKL
jgi:predicted transposase/invertase (TIGR01784 family)